MSALLPPVLRPLAVAAACVAASGMARADEAPAPYPAPPLPSARARWIGSPVTWRSLHGRVVLLDVWRYACTNCRATIPWIKDVRRRYAPRGLALVGIHTPAFTFEHEKDKVKAEVRRHGLDYPHLLDDDSAYWDALGAKAWPTVYLVDRCGRVRDRHVGEVHSNEETGQRLEARIEALLAEPASACGAAEAGGGRP
jgi:Redoxin